jgi:hypothetical protein
MSFPLIPTTRAYADQQRCVHRHQCIYTHPALLASKHPRTSQGSRPGSESTHHTRTQGSSVPIAITFARGSRNNFDTEESSPSTSSLHTCSP